jgi:ferrochelatase
VNGAGAHRSGVLLVGFGGPDSIESVRPFMCELTGREPSDESVDEVCKRYLAIGGQSPLPEIADAIATALAERLAGESGLQVPVLVGMRYTKPFISEAVDMLLEAGVTRVVLVALSPFESKVTHGAYREALAMALVSHPEVEVVEAPLIGTLDAFAELAAASAMSSLERLDPPTGALVVFTAHSLPLSDLTEDDPYVAGLKRVVDQICEFLGYDSGREGEGEPVLPGISTYGSLGGSTQPWVLAYQSKGKRGGEWLGPDIEEVIDAANSSGAKSIVAVPIGFVTDHLETLYDLDIMAADRALNLDMEFVRGPVANEHDHLISGLAEAVLPLL